MTIAFQEKVTIAWTAPMLLLPVGGPVGSNVHRSETQNADNVADNLGGKREPYRLSGNRPVHTHPGNSDRACKRDECVALPPTGYHRWPVVEHRLLPKPERHPTPQPNY